MRLLQSAVARKSILLSNNGNVKIATASAVRGGHLAMTPFYSRRAGLPAPHSIRMASPRASYDHHDVRMICQT